MKKNIIFIAISVALFLSSTIVNFWAASSGSTATVSGFILSVLFIAGVAIFPSLSKESKGFIKLSLCFMILTIIAAILWMLKSGEVIDSDFFIPVIVVLLTSFYGLTYAVASLNLLYSMIFIFALLGTVIILFFQKRKGKES